MLHVESEYLPVHHCKVDANQPDLFSELCFPHVTHTVAVIVSVTSQNKIKKVHYLRGTRFGTICICPTW